MCRLERPILHLSLALVDSESEPAVLFHINTKRLPFNVRQNSDRNAGLGEQLSERLARMAGLATNKLQRTT